MVCYGGAGQRLRGGAPTCKHAKCDPGARGSRMSSDRASSMAVCTNCGPRLRGARAVPEGPV
eukprot:4371584-Alexandrium_andersonii.AAC.1